MSALVRTALALLLLVAAQVYGADAFDGHVITKISVSNGDVFGDDDGSIYGAANALHIKTKEHIVTSQLLFREGDKFSSRLANESERLLRSNSFIRDAVIVARKTKDDEVVVQVYTFDTWSTKPSVSFGRVGGKSKTEFGLEEANFLGLGVQLGLSYREGVDRNSTTFQFLDRQLFDSWYALAFTHSDTSDGYLDYISLEKPFYSLDSKDAKGLSFRREKRSDSLYFNGDAYLSLDQTFNEYEISWGVSHGLNEGAVVRHKFGLQAYERNAVRSQVQPMVSGALIQEYIDGAPQTLDINEVYPFYEVSYLEDRFKSSKNVNKIARTEDVYLGARYRIRTGLVSSALGSDDDYMKLDAEMDFNVPISSSSFVSLGAEFGSDVYFDSGLDDKNTRLSYFSKVYLDQTHGFRFYADFVGRYSSDRRFGEQLYLDEENGLRGYPLRYLSGNKTQKVTVEQRYYSSREYFKLFNVGVAAFYDIGRISGREAFEEASSGTYRSVGVGLRITSNRSSQGNIIHIDLSTPLDADEQHSGMQLSIQTKKVF